MLNHWIVQNGSSGCLNHRIGMLPRRYIFGQRSRPGRQLSGEGVQCTEYYYCLVVIEYDWALQRSNAKTCPETPAQGRRRDSRRHLPVAQDLHGLFEETWKRKSWLNTISFSCFQVDHDHSAPAIDCWVWSHRSYGCVLYLLGIQSRRYNRHLAYD